MRSHTLTLPLDVLKTRIQSDAALAGMSLAAVCRRIVAAEGPRALLAGFTANGCGYFMQGAIKFGCTRRASGASSASSRRAALMEGRATACRSGSRRRPAPRSWPVWPCAPWKPQKFAS